MPYASLPDGDLYYEVKGEGEPVLLLRGLARSMRHWLGFDEKLAQSFQVITMDARGIGRSTAPMTPSMTIFDMARDAIAVTEAAGIRQFHVAGVSLGGMVALALALNHPNHVVSAVVINSSIAEFKRPRLTLSALGAMTYGIIRPDKIHEALGRVLVSPSFPERERQAMVEEWAQIASQEGTPVRTALFQIAAALRFRVAKDLAKIRVPTLVICGTDDRFVPNSNSEAIARYIPSAKLQYIRGGGHELMTDQGDALIASMQEFFAQHQKRRA